MLCDDCRAICVHDPAEKSVEPGKITVLREYPFISSFNLLKLSAQAGCRCCAFLQYCIESHANFGDYDLGAIEAAPVFLNWFEGFADSFTYEEGGAYLSVEPLRMYGDHGGSNNKAGVLSAKLELFTIRG
jgi:hypothetical protein